MIDAKFENERLLQEFVAFRRARLKRQQRMLNLIILSERFLNWMVKGYLRAVDSLVLAIIR
jgi:hypothetical protein